MELEALIPVSRISTEGFRTGQWSPRKAYHSEKVSPCREACPAGSDIPEFMCFAAEGRFDEALKEILHENPLPGVCGRVCPHPCQDHCNRSNLEGAVQIREVERAVAEYGRGLPQREEGKVGGRIAVVGSGPAGLSAAYFLGRLGHRVTVFERQKELGGVLRYGIPEYRLPKGVLQKEIERLKALEIDFVTSTPLHRETILSLRQDFDAVILATGAWSPRRLGIRGEELQGVFYGLPWLSSPSTATTDPRRIVVIGGGDVAVDVARVSRRLYPEARIVMVAPEREGEFPAIPEGLLEAAEEGIEIEGGWRPLEFLGEGGRLKGIRFRRCEVHRDPDAGTYRITDLEGERIEEAQMVIVSIGQVPEWEVLPQGLKQGHIETTPWGETAIKGLFLAGDLVNRKAAVVEAISSGKRTALGVHLRLLGDDPQKVLSEVKIGGGRAVSFKAFLKGTSKRLDRIAEFSEVSRYLFPECPPIRPGKLDPGERKFSFREVKFGLGKEEASHEAGRCFNCGKCTGCDLCFFLCPDLAILKGDPYSVNPDYCKGCGICVEACPRDVVEMR